jgi:hypothetical protein
MCAVVRLRALMARQAARLITNPPIASAQRIQNCPYNSTTNSHISSAWYNPPFVEKHAFFLDKWMEKKRSLATTMQF